MVRQGRKPEKLVLAWDILRRKADMIPCIGTKRVEYPLKVLVSSGISAPGPILTRLEKAKYIEKHTNGTRELVWIKMLKMTDLGEDILASNLARSESSDGHKVAGHEEPPEPARQEIVETDDIEQHFSQENTLGDVVIVCDYENLRYTLEEDGTELDFSRLIESARQYGNVLRSIAFMPVFTAADVQTELRMSGFRIEVCPPRKLNGPDTCDQSIEEFVRFCLNYTRIGTFVLVSGDGDFIDIVDEIENNGRKWVLFHCNHRDTSKALFARAGNAINIASIARPKAKARAIEPVVVPNPPLRTVAEGRYKKLIEGLRDGTAALDKDDAQWSFLKAIISCLKDMGLASEDARYRKSFPELKAAVWQEVYREFNRLGLTKDGDCHGALSALRKLSIIQTMSQDEAPHTYYVLDRNHPLVVLTLAASTKQKSKIT